MAGKTVNGVHPGSVETVPVVGVGREQKRRGPKPRPLADRLWEKVEKRPGDGCWVFLGSRHSDGYGQIGMGGHCGKMIGAHRAAWILEHGPIPPGMDVCHKCDNPPCCRPDHLFLGTRSENMKDAWDKGRIDLAKTWGKNRGERNGHARLRPEQVEEIRQRKATATAAELAAEFGVSRNTVYVIWQRRAWRHLEAA